MVQQPIFIFIHTLIFILMLILFPEGQIRSGKLGSLTFSKRGYVSPTKIHSQPINLATTNVRFRFSELNSFWRDGCRSTPGFKYAWDSYNISIVNRVGNVVNLSGKAAFVRVNQYLFQSKQSPIIFPDVNAVVPNLHKVSLAPIVSISSIVVSCSINSTVHSVNVFATAPLSTGVSVPDLNVFRKLGTLDYTATSHHNVFSQYIKVFGNCPVGCKIGLSVQAISAFGIPSVPHTFAKIAT